MTIFCHNCHQWTLLAPDLGAASSAGARPQPTCAHCSAPLPHAESRYGLCSDCGRYHRVDYETCPFKVEGALVGADAEADPTVLREANEPYTVEAQKRRPKKRSDDYYWQLYFDYRDKAQHDFDNDEPDASSAEPAAYTVNGSDGPEEPPHPADMPEYVASPASTNGNGTSARNGNGHAARSNGVDASTHASTKVDLAVSDSPNVMLFADAEPAASVKEDEGPTRVSAGNYNEFEYELIQDQSRLAQVAELLATEKVLGIDTETTGLDPYTVDLLLLQISTADKVYIVDCKRVVPLALKAVLENPDILKIAQNAKFEYVMLRQQVGITLNGIFDTMLAERLLTAGISREISLKAISQKYIGAVLDKSVRESFYKLAAVGDAYLAPEQLHYAARDAYIMIPIWKQMLPGLKKQGLLPVADLEFKCIPAVGDMELAGVQIDVVRWRNIISGVAVQREKAAEELTELLAPASMQATMFGVSSINLNSNVQLLEAFNHLGVIMPDTMESTLVKYDHPVVAKLLEYRSHEKTLSAFGENVLSLINPLTGRIHPDFNQYGADTGRFSCTKPNVQQIPSTSDFRKCFIAAPGYKLVTCDYSQCIAVDTWVSTHNSWVRIQDHPDAISKGTSPTVILTTNRRYRVECTPDHRVLTNSGWRQTQDLQAGDWIALEGQSVDDRELFDARSWLMGFWVGDGSLHSSPGSLYFAKGVESGVAELAGYIEETLGEKPRETPYSLYVTNQRQTADLYRSLFHKKDLRLPLDRMEHITSFLSGLFDADGTSGKFGVSLSTRFEGLAQDVQTALLRYGIISTVVSGIAGRNMVPGGKLRYEVRISDSISLANFDRFIGFRLSAKRAVFQAYTLREKRDLGNILPIPVGVMRQLGVERVQYIKNHEQNRPYTRHRLAGLKLAELGDYTRYHWDRVGSVTETGRSVEVFDLVDQPEERFVAAGVVVHNCELRVLAELSGDPAFVEAFQSGQDLHTLTAAQMFGVTVEEVAKPQRSAAKAINFGLAYGMGPGGLAPRLGVSLDEAKALISRYFAAYPGIQKWLDKAAKDSVRLGYSVTPLGRKRFYNLPDESLKRSSEDDWRKQIAAIERQGKNSPIQGCVRGNVHIFDRTYGYATIESLCGRAVSVWDGERFSGASVVYSGKKQLVKVTLRGGHYIECSPDHKFLVACNNGYKWVWKWKIATEIKAQNRVVLGNPVGEWHGEIAIPVATAGKAHNANSASLVDIGSIVDMGEWLGRLASDGNIGKNNAIHMLVAEHEERILPHLAAITAQMGSVKDTIRVTESQPRRLHRLTICSRSLSDQLRAIGAKERIPHLVWRDSTLLAAYLRGLFDGDGTVHPDGALLTLGQGDKHIAWAREVQEALLLFGIRSRINTYKGKHNRINLRVLKRDMPLFCEKVGFINPIKQERAELIKSERWERVSPQYGMAMLVESVEVTDDYVDMYDVVNSETSRFMANGLVVHNCNADMTKLALINLRAALSGWDARTVNTVHDEIVVEAREDQAEEVKHLVEEAMLDAGKAILKEVPIVADAAVADYWSK